MEKLGQLIEEYHDSSADSVSETGPRNAAEMKIEVTAEVLVRFRLYGLSFAD